ncbi:DNA repair protein recO [Spiroplasma sp. NBRC 100390]|uniref:DNA repair protein RecO n=1 Tax=unclassified Spiroplasma TaxID=2637901 RepID=UPI000892960C|nr:MULTISPECIES: DNA repair protein RecO [unclassified Spiroplasma]AOX43684.1 DNA repair protein recO [Spiroplasma sp. TU-14]APE13154.1 DNA repair protein recO [Spiroplasma sp. NBRC 100390]
MTTKVTGIVINKQSYDDDSEIITVFTKELGKLAFFAPGVRKITSKNQYAVQLLATSEFEIFLSYQTSKLSKLKTGNLLITRIKLTQNYDDYLLATLLCEITEQAVEERFSDLKLYDLLSTALNNLLAWEDNLTVVIVFMFQVLKWYGLQWNLTMCKRCGGKSNIKTISFIEEGYICKNCYLPTDYLFSIELVKIFSMTSLDNFYFHNKINVKEMIVLFKMLCEYYLTKVGIFSYSIYEMQKKSIYFK